MLFFHFVFFIFSFERAIFPFLFIRADKGKDQYLFLQLEMVEENSITVLTMDMPTVPLLLPFLESVEMEVSLDMLRGVQR